MSRHALASLLATFVVAASGSMFIGCQESAVGAPCESDTDCDVDLICDVHDGQGTCQEGHGHEGGGDCAAETRADDYAVGLSKSGAIVTATFVTADPTPPAMGDNTWVLTLTDADGVALDELDVVVTPMMPDHGHGTPVEAVVTATGNPGEYSVSPVNLFMAGYWEIDFAIDVAGAQDTVQFGFCVE